MKILFLALMMAINSFASDFNLIIDNYKPIPGMDFQLELVVRNPIANHQLLLDCQSFINGIHYMNLVDNKWHDVWFMMLSGNDCENVSSFSVDAINRSSPFCLNVNLDQHQLNVSADASSCL